MKKLVVTISAALLLCLSLVGTSLANEKNLKKTFMLNEDVMINDKMIKKGEYRVVFNAKTEEVTLSKDGDVVYSGKAMIEVRPDKSRYNSASFKSTDKGKMLNGFTFAGDRRAVILSEATNTTAGE